MSRSELPAKLGLLSDKGLWGLIICRGRSIEPRDDKAFPSSNQDFLFHVGEPPVHLRERNKNRRAQAKGMMGVELRAPVSMHTFFFCTSLVEGFSRGFLKNAATQGAAQADCALGC